PRTTELAKVSRANCHASAGSNRIAAARPSASAARAMRAAPRCIIVSLPVSSRHCSPERARRQRDQRDLTGCGNLSGPAANERAGLAAQMRLQEVEALVQTAHDLGEEVARRHVAELIGGINRFTHALGM